MSRFARRPVVVDAVQWTGANFAEIAYFLGGWKDEVRPDPDSHSLLVDTPDGRMRCAATDWLIRNAQGDYSLCRNDNFELTYEAVDVFQEQ